MSKFKVGDKVIRTTGVDRDISRRTGVQRGSVYTVYSVGPGGLSVQLVESKERTFRFSVDAFSLADPSSTWDVNEALRLRDLAVRAIQEYNTYLLQQPLLEAIDIPPIK